MLKYLRSVGGNWSANASWSTTSNGSADTVKPTASDDVILDSFSGQLTIDENGFCRSLDCNGYTNTLTRPASAFKVSVGDATAGANNIAVRLATGMTVTNGGGVANIFDFISTATTQQTIDFKGKNFGNAYITFNSSSGGNYKIVNMDGGSFCRITLTKAQLLEASNITWNIGQFVSSNANARVLDITNSTVNLLHSSASPVWDCGTSTNMTLISDGSTIDIGSSSTLRVFAGGGLTYGILEYNVAGATGGLDITGSNSFEGIRFSDASNARTLRFTAGTTTTIRNPSIFPIGTSGKLMVIDTITASTHNIVLTGGRVNSNYLNIKNSVISGGSGAYAGANSTDSGGNTGWIFTEAPPIKPVLASGGLNGFLNLSNLSSL